MMGCCSGREGTLARFYNCMKDIPLLGSNSSLARSLCGNRLSFASFRIRGAVPIFHATIDQCARTGILGPYGWSSKSHLEHLPTIR